MRLIFIPGFGERPNIFEKIAPAFAQEKLFIDNLDLIGSKPQPDITSISYAQKLIDSHNITANDVIIGHSMGGWIAHAVKHLVGCPVVQIASWTDPNKVVAPLKNPNHVYWLVRNGLYLNKLNKQIFIWLNYGGKRSARIFGETFDYLIGSNKEYVINQLRIIFNPLPVQILTQPDLRIHSKRDTIIRFPDEQAVEVPEDHFNLWTHPEAVIKPLKQFLDGLQP